VGLGDGVGQKVLRRRSGSSASVSEFQFWPRPVAVAPSPF